MSEFQLPSKAISHAEFETVKEKLNQVAHSIGQPLNADTLFFKAPFEEVPELFVGRRVFLQKGFVYVVMHQAVSLVATQFRSNLSKCLVLTNRSIIYLSGELNRFQPGVRMEIFRLDAWYFKEDLLINPTNYIVSVSLAKTGNLKDHRDALVELAASSEYGILHLFSHHQLQFTNLKYSRVEIDEVRQFEEADQIGDDKKLEEVVYSSDEENAIEFPEFNEERDMVDPEMTMGLIFSTNWLTNGQGIAFISDRQKGLVETSEEVYPGWLATTKIIVEDVVASVKVRGRSTARFVIHKKSDVYQENVEITNSMEKLMMTTNGMDATVVTGSRSFKDGYTTF
ncbi:hypothetical protein ZIOFF_039410 [Zingiber officinale]|uniref:Pectinesterase catalytic domain-containing protein n=1 Tax=Zingiber officinale TaxID=94328 RepID=A0A8J5G372_ZINOF|nr:hypothetical protein ZIOFF_039410 [Zingiber officinale]